MKPEGEIKQKIRHMLANEFDAYYFAPVQMGMGASTVDIVDQILARLPEIRAAAPPGMRIEPLFDQSVFVRAAVRNVLNEGVLVGPLVATVVLLFIGSLRSTLVVLTSIPLALLGSVAALHATGQTFNLMTLGGLGLAIGILVDNALVEIENCNRRIAAGEPVREAILNSAGEVVFPEFVSTLCICIVFLPIFLLTGVPAYVFKPMACAVVFAMIGSFLLSRTLVPCLAYLLIPGELRRRAAHGLDAAERVHHHVERALDAVRDRYVTLLQLLASRAWLLWVIVLVALGVGVMGARQLEQGFFPRTDAGLMRLHVRVPTGTRLEETARIFSDVQLAIRRVVPAHEIDVITEVIGQPEPVNLAWIDSAAAGSFDGEIDIELTPGHAPITRYQAALRRMLAAAWPELRIVAECEHGPAAVEAIDEHGPDIAFLDNRVLVAGLSNEEFSSTLRSIPFPFQKSVAGANVEIYHGAHGRFETRSPIRTFVPFVAGVSAMTRSKFTRYNVLGGFIWVMGLTIAGFWFGNLPFVQTHLSKIIWALIFVPGLIAVIGAWRARKAG